MEECPTGKSADLSDLMKECINVVTKKDAREMLANFHFSFVIPFVHLTQGAATTCYVALHPSLKGVTGNYFLDCNEMEPSALARDERLAKKLWDFSNKLVDSASKD